LRERTRSPHPDACRECAEWTLSAVQQIAALTGLSRLVPARALDVRLARELAGERDSRLVRALTSLVRHGAPSALDELVAEDIARLASGAASRVPAGDEARGERQAQAVRALDVYTAPHVLERLLDEELRAPEAARAERFTGNLERLSAPLALDRRLRSQARHKAFRRLILAPVLTLTAAGVALWFLIRGEERVRPQYSFEVVHATSVEDLDPMARQIAQILGGSDGRGGLR